MEFTFRVKVMEAIEWTCAGGHLESELRLRSEEALTEWLRQTGHPVPPNDWDRDGPKLEGDHFVITYVLA